MAVRNEGIAAERRMDFRIGINLGGGQKDRLGTELAASWMVGDRWVDIAAGRDAGTRTVLVDQPWSWAATSSGAPPDGLVADHRVRDLAEAVELILTN